MRTLFLATLVFASFVFGGEWIATWNPNTEPDLAGYQFYWIDEGEIGKTETLGKVTEYRFTAGDSVCAWLRAYDEAGNISEPSETVCVKKASVPIPGDPNLVYCDTLVIELPPITVTVHDTLRLWYPVEVVKWDTLTVTVHDTTVLPEHPRVQFTDGKLVGVITQDSIKIERNDLLRLQYLNSKEDFFRRIDIKLKNLPCPEPEPVKTDWLKYAGFALGGLAVILLFINIFRDKK